ncbi:putative undecaprenyl-diphosphatase YbjG [compost metagenome]
MVDEMKLKVQLTRALFISFFSAIGFGLLALSISEDRISKVDHMIISVIQGLESPILTSIMKFFTFTGGGTPVVIVSLVVGLLLFKILHHRRELILFIWVVIGSSLLNDALKLIFHRARPELHRMIDVNGFSFPSGHSMAAFSLYGVMAFLLWRHTLTSIGRGVLIAFSVAMILMIGISRIYLGVHYPSDVLGGFLASGCWLSISIWFYQRYMENLFKVKYG